MIQITFWAVFILPLISLFFLDRSVIRRYISVALFVTVINVILYEIAWTQNWWKYDKSLFSWDKITPAPLVFSAYWVATIWIFHFTFRKFWVYFVTNLILDGVFVYALVPWMRKVEIVTGNLSGILMLLIMTIVANVIYVYQMWYEKQEGN